MRALIGDLQEESSKAENTSQTGAGHDSGLASASGGQSGGRGGGSRGSDGADCGGDSSRGVGGGAVDVDRGSAVILMLAYSIPDRSMELTRCGMQLTRWWSTAW